MNEDTTSDTTVDKPYTSPLSDLALQRLVADGRRFYRCGCGFVAVLDDTDVMDPEGHPCPLVTPHPVQWHERAFSMPGLLMVGIIAYAVVIIATSR